MMGKAWKIFNEEEEEEERNRAWESVTDIDIRAMETCLAGIMILRAQDRRDKRVD